MLFNNFEDYLDAIDLEYNLYYYKEIKNCIYRSREGYVNLTVLQDLPFLSKILFEWPINGMDMKLEALTDYFVQKSVNIPDDQMT